jgi:hypothetical protein
MSELDILQEETLLNMAQQNLFFQNETSGLKRGIRTDEISCVPITKSSTIQSSSF